MRAQGKLGSRLEKCQYKTMDEFAADVRLVFDNCVQFAAHINDPSLLDIQQRLRDVRHLVGRARSLYVVLCSRRCSHVPEIRGQVRGGGDGSRLPAECAPGLAARLVFATVSVGAVAVFCCQRHLPSCSPGRTACRRTRHRTTGSPGGLLSPASAAAASPKPRPRTPSSSSARTKKAATPTPRAATSGAGGSAASAASGKGKRPTIKIAAKGKRPTITITAKGTRTGKQVATKGKGKGKARSPGRAGGGTKSGGKTPKAASTPRNKIRIKAKAKPATAADSTRLTEEKVRELLALTGKLAALPEAESLLKPVDTAAFPLYKASIPRPTCVREVQVCWSGSLAARGLG